MRKMAMSRQTCLKTVVSITAVLIFGLLCGILIQPPAAVVHAGDFSGEVRERVLATYYSDSLVAGMKSDADPIIKAFG